MERQVKKRQRAPNKVVHLYTQAERARKLATKCGSPLVAELFELHAEVCDRNAQLNQEKRRRK